MKCKSCGVEMDEGMNFCPTCGANQKAEEKAAKLTPAKIVMLVVLAVIAVALAVALVKTGTTGGTDETEPPETTTAPAETTETTEATVPADGDPDGVACKGSYTTDDETLSTVLDTVVATLGDGELTNRELQVYYWLEFYNFLEYYASYAQWIGLDYTQPLDTQVSVDESMTWQQYFLSSSLNSWQYYQALCLEAEAADFELPQDFRDSLDNLRAEMDAGAVEAGYADADEMIQADMGSLVTLDDYARYLEEYYTGYLYYVELIESIDLTDGDVEAFFDENQAAYAENGVEKDGSYYVDVRHVLITPQGGTEDADGNVTYSDDEWEACRQEAQKLLDAWLAGDGDEASFAEMANEYSQDPGSNTNGGLYEQVAEGDMLETFDAWCFDGSRKSGDTGLVETVHGFHIMYFVDSTPVWYATAMNDLLSERSATELEDMLAKYDLTVDYSLIALGDVDLAANMTVTE